jgi:hypothetical protein
VRRKLLAAVALAGALAGSAGAGLFGTDYNNIEYLCCNWGPALTLPSKSNAAAQFNDAEDEVYFLKQIGSFTRKKRLLKDVWSGRDYEDIGRGISIWLCKMKADGSGKNEIRELWKNPNYPIDTQSQSTWMDVNRKTHKIALSITSGGSDVTGLWTLNLDGSELKHIITPTFAGRYLPEINHVSWTPDGEWIYFEEWLAGSHPQRYNITKCDKAGGSRTTIFEATEKVQYKEPSVSPDGKQLAFSRYPNGYPGGRYLWTSTVDGKDAAPIGGKDSQQNWGSYPVWSPDGNRILLGGAGLIDVESGEIINWRSPKCGGVECSYGWAHWGKAGLIGFNLSGILFTDNEIKISKALGVSRLVECSGNADADRW